MIIAIDPVCRKCGKNDPEHIPVSDWDKVKSILEIRPGWACPYCGCKAAYWYYHRNAYKEGLTLKQVDEVKEQAIMTLFGSSGDDKVNIPADVGCEKLMIHPVTREVL
jgi:hypothetical protein